MMWSRRNIWFYCPACENKLVVGAEAGGYRADCPECGVNIPIPARSTALPAWVKKAAVLGVQALLIVGGSVLGWRLAIAPRADDRVDLDVKEAREEGIPADAAGSVPDSEPGAQAQTALEINQQLLNDHVDLQGRYNKVIQWMIENYRGKYPLPERLVSRLRIAPFTDDGQINPDLVEMLRLTGSEASLVQDVITYVRDAIQETERKQIRVTDQADHRITFSVPTFAEIGAELKEDLYLTLETTLGEQRMDRMVDVAGEAMREQFHYFGEASRTLTFEVIFPAVEGAHSPYLLIRDGWIIPEGESVRLTKVTETAVTRLPESYQSYREWLPENLSRYALP